MDQNISGIGVEANPFHVLEAPASGVEVLHGTVIAANHLVRTQIEPVDLRIYSAGKEELVISVGNIFQVRFKAKRSNDVV